jgi:myotubularin-like phosphatase protein
MCILCCPQQALVEKDWLAFGHPFSDRTGLPTLSGSGHMPSELSRQSSTSSLHSSPIRQQSGSFAQPSGSSHSHSLNHYSPILLQVRLLFYASNLFTVGILLFVLAFVQCISSFTSCHLRFMDEVGYCADSWLIKLFGWLSSCEL